MLEPIRAVSPLSKPRCPQCHCFVRLDAGTCSACSFPLAVAPRSQSVAVAPEVPSRQSLDPFSNLQPDGKIKKPSKKQPPSSQLNLFEPVDRVDGSDWLQGVLL